MSELTAAPPADVKGRFKAIGLTTPLVAFILIAFIFPLGNMFLDSFYDATVAEALPETASLLNDWDGTELPPSQVFDVIATELQAAYEARSIGKVATRVNRIQSGTRTVFTKTARRVKEVIPGQMKDELIKIDKRWGELRLWQAIAIASERFTIRHYLNAIDLKFDLVDGVTQVAEELRIYNTLYLRTLYVSLSVTVLCFLIGYPIAYAMANSPTLIGKAILIMVLIPFWTSLLVRTVSWIVLLQQQGVLNDILVGLGFVADNERLTLVYNMTGTLVAMTHVLLPFMVLPLYSVMRSIPTAQVRAAASLGANPIKAFVKVYWPQSIPGVGAGGLLVFILSIGYYITPALVGGTKGQLISNMVAYHIQGSLNWGLAAAISIFMLTGVFVLYVIYDRLIGIDKMKLG